MKTICIHDASMNEDVNECVDLHVRVTTNVLPTGNLSKFSLATPRCLLVFTYTGLTLKGSHLLCPWIP